MMMPLKYRLLQRTLDAMVGISQVRWILDQPVTCLGGIDQVLNREGDVLHAHEPWTYEKPERVAALRAKVMEELETG